jgi:hypothetical protein
MRKAWTFEIHLDTSWWSDEYGDELERLDPTEATKQLQGTLQDTLDDLFGMKYVAQEIKYIKLKKLEMYDE